MGAVVETKDGQRVKERAIEVEGRRYRLVRVDLVTDLPETVDAVTVAALYRKRWALETAFQHLEKHFESEINTLATLDSAQPEPVSQTVSTYYVGHEIASTFLALLTLIEAEDWRFLAELTPAEFARWLSDVASGVNPKKYQKHGRGPKKPRRKISHDPNHPHVSTHRLLQARGDKNSGDGVATP